MAETDKAGDWRISFFNFFCKEKASACDEGYRLQDWQSSKNKYDFLLCSCFCLGDPLVSMLNNNAHMQGDVSLNCKTKRLAVFAVQEIEKPAFVV